jgi:protein-S-isoprenylcysteine O-methyltransferase Ste14
VSTAVAGGALLLYLAGLVVTFGLRAVIHRRRTGSSGMHGISGRPFTLPWWGGALFVLAIVMGLAAPALQLLDLVAVPEALVDLWPVGLVAAATGLGIVLASQANMGSSWAVGVDDDAPPTALVTTGLFRVVRNPVFSGMLVAQTGMLIMVPTGVSLASLLCLVAAVEIQVRVIEEPYLIASHDEEYLRYARRTGRLVPGAGRLDPGTRRAFPTRSP